MAGDQTIVMLEEAHASGIPVLGSDLGGDCWACKTQVDGFNEFAQHDVRAWTDALARLAVD